MVGRKSKAGIVSLILVVGLGVAPAVGLSTPIDAGDAADPIAGVADQDEDAVNTTLEDLWIQRLSLENVTIENTLIKQATVDGDERSNVTVDSVTVENVTLMNVTFESLTMSDRELMTKVVGQARGTQEQNNTLDTLELRDRTIDGMIIDEATLRDSADVQFDVADAESGTAGTEQVTASEAELVIGNVTVESVAQNVTDPQSDED